MNNKLILIVDDNQFDRELLTAALTKKMGLSSIAVKNSEECLDFLNTTKVDLVLMDIMMPTTRGTDTLIKIREKFNALELPVIMVTSKAESSDLINCLKDGANDYITKPVNFDVAISRITTHLKLVEMSNEMAAMKETLAIGSMISTYNHEINNPLAIAIGYISGPDWNEESNGEKLKAALWRISDIVKKIKALSDKRDVVFHDYSDQNKTIKID